jgi:Tfp pilus assembly protein PilF
MRILGTAALVVVVGSCASTSNTPTPAPVAPVAEGASPAPALATEEAPAAPAAPVAGSDGIDEENWLPPTDSDAYRIYREAVGLMGREPGRAAQRFVAAAEANPAFYAAWFNAGVAAETAGDNTGAEEHYKKALVVRPDHGPALGNLALLLGRSQRDGEAAKLIEDAKAKHAERAGPHLAAAMRAQQRNEPATVEKEALSALRFDERNVGAMYLMARLFRQQGRLDTARFAVENALALEPGNALLLVEQGRLLEADKDIKGALVAYEKAARMRPQLAEAQECYGLLLLQTGLAADARNALAAVVAVAPSSARAHLHLANAQRAVKDYGAAEQSYRKALELDAADADAHFNLGVLYIDNVVGNPDDVLRWQGAIAELKLFLAAPQANAADKTRANNYVEATEKRLAKEIKRREREEKRKREDSAAPAAAPTEVPAAATPADPTKETPAATEPKADAPPLAAEGT